MQNMKAFYNKAEKLIDELPDAIPEKTREMLKDKILGDKELKQLMEGIDNHRPPRIFLIGRTGVGKSSLINALCGAYTAGVSDTKSCTESAQIYECKDGDRTLMEILDTRGIAESDSLNTDVSAEDMLIEEVNKFSPDVAILMLNCTHRDDVNSDVEFLKKVAKSYAETNNLRLPIVVVVNKCDEMAPSRFKKPAEYPQNKIDKINEVVQYYKGIIVKNGLKIDNIIAVSSLIDWQTPDGMEIDVEDIPNLPVHDINNLEIAFDGRYNIEELLDILEEAIQDFEAQMGLRMASRLTEVVHRLARHLNSIFSGLSGTVALTPIPVSDIYVLLIIQTLLVSLIASLSGRDISLDTAKEFIFSMGGIAGAGYVFRLVAQQVAKFINAIWPGAGSAVSAGVAAVGTSAIGKAAISYYIDGETIEAAKKKFEEGRQEKEAK
ncbi:GTPase [Lachnospira multipara]|uniref:GTPase n=1 Tax=Lachnospira multipara TaxID=28051 RepID=UPI0018CC69D3|nr:GTPase [Lachnospira multipara]